MTRPINMASSASYQGDRGSALSMEHIRSLTDLQELEEAYVRLCAEEVTLIIMSLGGRVIASIHNHETAPLVSVIGGSSHHIVVSGMAL